MTYYYQPEQMLLSKFNVANKLNLLPEHVRFENPRPADTADITMSKVYNTAIDLVMLPGAPYDGIKTIFYNRVSLRTEFGNAKLDDKNYIFIANETSLRECITAINTRLGTRLTAEDIEDYELPVGIVMPRAIIRVKPDHLIYTGSIDVRLYRATAKKHILNNNPNPLWYFDGLRKTFEGPTRLEIVPFTRNYHVDYTAAFGVINRFVVADSIPVVNNNNTDQIELDAQDIQALMLVDKLPWNTGGTDGLSLVRSTCIYRGPTKDCLVRPYGAVGSVINGKARVDGWDTPFNPANQAFTHVAAVITDTIATVTTRYKSMVLFHYNA